MSINVTVVGSTGVNASIASSDSVLVSVGGTIFGSPAPSLLVEAGANITVTTASGSFTIIGRDVPVVSVNGQTGTVVLNLANLTAAAASHTHVMANITDLAYPVNVVNGQTGTVVLTSTDVSAASAVHTHVAANISNLTSVANVVSVNGQTGVAVLNSTNVSAASAVHTHVAANISNLTSVANVVSVNGITGTPSIVAGSGITVSTSGSSITVAAGSGLPAQGGNASRLLSTDGTAASWATRYSVVDGVLAAGSGISFAKNTSLGSITIQAAGGTSGVTVGSATPQPLGVAAAGVSGNAAREDHVHAMPSAADVGAASATHTHTASSITNLTAVANVVSVNGITGVPVIVGGLGVTVSTSGSSITIAASGSTSSGASLSSDVPQALGTASAGVSTLASRADHVHPMPSAANVGAASAVHTHLMADVTDLAFPVSSVNGKTGTVSLTSVDVSAASAVHAHLMADVTDLAFPVSSVNGKTGTVSLTITDLTAAAATHAHKASDITDLTSFANVVSVNGLTGVVTVNLGDALPAHGGNAGRVLATDGTSASWATRYSVVEPVLLAGAGMSFSKDTSAGQITIESLSGIVGSTAASVVTKSLSSSQNDYDAGVADIVRLTTSDNVTLTGLAGGTEGVIRLLYNVGTHVVTIASDSASSDSTNRFSIVSGNLSLAQGDSASIWYDGTSQRWRVMEDQGAGGGGGGIAMSYLFG